MRGDPGTFDSGRAQGDDIVHHPGIALHPGPRPLTDVLDTEPDGAVPGTAALGTDPASHGTSPSEALLFQRCRWCGSAMYQRLLCPVCAGSDLRTEASTGTGVVRHATVIHRNTPAARNVSLVEMAEGFTVRGRVTGPATDVHSGDRVQLTTAQDPVRSQPVFQLVDGPYRSRS
ncbi:OB-fold domain-containing protein [Streptomyces sp. NPDC051639]|uniref:Zn-ribbon domain-containing OB-fold protein n=1 Tax=Streptomyces sp. NPDC051639 TaxID=3155671 RepID=UPI00341A0BA1